LNRFVIYFNLDIL